MGDVGKIEMPDPERVTIEWLKSAPQQSIRHPRLPPAPSLLAECYGLDMGWVIWLGAASCYGLTKRGKEIINHAA